MQPTSRANSKQDQVVVTRQKSSTKVKVRELKTVINIIIYRSFFLPVVCHLSIL